MKNIWLKNSKEKHLNHKDEIINDQQIIDMFNRCDLLIQKNHKKTIEKSQKFSDDFWKQLDKIKKLDV